MKPDPYKHHISDNESTCPPYYDSDEEFCSGNKTKPNSTINHDKIPHIPLNLNYDISLRPSAKKTKPLLTPPPLIPINLKNEYSRVTVQEKQMYVQNRNTNHGFAAEILNNKIDQLCLKDAKVLGITSKNSPDRLVNGTIHIQTKFCKRASSTARELWNSTENTLKYLNPDGTPMICEVPFDQYADIVNNFERKGVDPSFLKQSTFTYKTAVRMTQCFTIESVTYDAATGMVQNLTLVPLTFIFTLVLFKVQGASWKDALSQAFLASAGVGVINLGTAVVFGQASKSKFLRRTMTAAGEKLTAKLLISFGSESSARMVAVASGSAVIVLSVVGTTALFSLPDAMTLARGRMSKLQFLKNLTVRFAGTTTGTVGGAVGGSVGATAGGAIGGCIGGAVGTLALPVVGTVSGAAVGGIIGGAAGGASLAMLGGIATALPTELIARKILKTLSKDDAILMQEIVNQQLLELFEDNLFCDEECESVLSNMEGKVKWNNEFKILYALGDAEKRKERARSLVEPYVQQVVKERKPISKEEIEKAYREAQQDVKVEVVYEEEEDDIGSNSL